MKVTGKWNRAGLLGGALLAGMLAAGCAAEPATCPINPPTGPQSALMLTPEQAAGNLGKKATVTGRVVGADYRQENDGSPTFLDFGAPYPKPVFIVLIWGADRAKFGEPEKTYNGQRVAVTGKILVYHDKPTIIVSEPEQIKIVP